MRDLDQKQAAKPTAPPSFSPLDPFGPSSSSAVVNVPTTVTDSNVGQVRKSSKAELKPLPLTPNPTPEMSAAGSPIVDLDSSASSSIISVKNPACLDDLEVPLENIKPGNFLKENYNFILKHKNL